MASPVNWLKRYTLAEFNKLLANGPAVPISHVVYVFFAADIRGEKFPCVYLNQQLAEKAPRRVTPVVRVEVPLA